MLSKSKTVVTRDCFRKGLKEIYYTLAMHFKRQKNFQLPSSRISSHSLSPLFHVSAFSYALSSPFSKDLS